MLSVLRHLSRMLGRWALLAFLWVGLPVSAQVQVSDASQTGNSLAAGNTTRKIDVHPNGTIYVCYHGSNGVRVARSLDNGATFGPSVQVLASTSVEAEIAVASTGIIYVSYVSGGNAYVARSLDQGLTFQAPVEVGSVGGGTVHSATDGQYLYLIDRPGANFYASSDNGQTFSHVALGNFEAFSDVHVDPLNHNVVLVLEDVSVFYQVSADYGATFSSAAQIPSAAIMYSVGALSSGVNGRYLLVTGVGGSASLNLASLASTTPSWPDESGTAETDSIAADIYGNVVIGYTSGGSVLYNVSNDIAGTFGSAATVATADIGSAAINTTNGDTLVAYETGGAIYLRTYPGLLIDYDLAVSTSNVTFATQTNHTSSSAKTVTVTNQSSSAVTINSVGISGDYSQTNTAPATLAPGASFGVSFTFTPTASGLRAGAATITYNSSLQRVVSLSGTGTSTAGVGNPSTQASGLGISGVTGTQLTATWIRGNGSACAVFLAQASSGQASPADFQGYTASPAFGSGGTAGTGWYCVYNGTGTSVTVTGLAAGSTYRVFVVEYTGASGNEVYNTNASSANLTNQVAVAGNTLLFPVPPPTTVSMSSSGSATFSLSVSSQGTVTSPVTLSASGLPAGCTCTFSPASVNISSGPVTVHATITPNPGLLILGRNRGTDPLGGFGVGTGALLACGVLASGRRRKRMGIFLSVLLLALVGGLTACSSHSSSAAATTGSAATVAAGTYPVTITATSNGAVQATTTFNLTIN